MAKDPYDIRDIFEEMTLSLIASLKRNLMRHREWEQEEGFRWEQWQAAKLRAIVAYQRRNRMIVSEAAKEAEKLIDDVTKQSFETGQKRQGSLWDRFVNTVLKPFGRKRVPTSGELKIPEDVKLNLPIPIKPELIPWEDLPEVPPEQDFFGMNEKKLQALQDGIKEDLRKVNGAALRKMDDVYRQTIYKAGTYMTAGAQTLEQAVDMATKEFLQRGIDSVTYVDGRRVNIASYAEMALRTLSQRATFMGEGTKRNEWGVYTVVMSAHDNCSPWCLPFQGTVMIDDVYTSIDKDKAAQLSRDTGYLLLSYAMQEGAFHPACRHTLATFFPGISRMPTLPDEEKANRNYEAEQKQRYIERMIRMYKRLEAGSLDPANQVKYGRKVQEWKGRMDEHLGKYPELRRDRSREKIEGEVTAPERKLLLKNASDREKIEEVRKQIRSDVVPKNIHEGQQGKHIKGHNNYIDGKSYLTITMEEAQELIDRYAGTGKLRITRKGGWDNKELIVSNRSVGYALDKHTGEAFETTAFKVHYGKKGVHIVPTKWEE